MSSFHPCIAVTHSQSVLPTKFRYTCCCWVVSSPLFIGDCFAVGTEEGSIMLFVADENGILPASVLCGHIGRVSGLILTLQSKVFVSACENGSICVWSCSDGLCVRKFDNILPIGNNILYLHHANASYLWNCNYGLSCQLFDLTSGKIILNIYMPGITSLSLITSENSPFVEKTTLVLVGVNHVRADRFEDDKVIVDHRHYFPFNKNEIISATPFGIVRLRGMCISIFKPSSTSPILDINLPDQQNDDFLSCLQWMNKGLMCVGTCKGCFYIIELNPPRIHQKSSLSVLNIETLKSNSCFLSSQFDICPVNGILFTSYKSLTLIRKNKFVQVYNPNDKGSLFHCTDPHESFILKDNNTSFQMVNWLDFSVSSPSFAPGSSNITSIFSRIIPSKQSKTQIIVGCDDGSVHFFWANQPSFIRSVDALPSPIIGFVSLPIKILGRESFVAIGEDGSTALFKWMDVYLRYPTSGFQILSVYIISDQELIVFRRKDGLFFVFNFVESVEVGLFSYPPIGSTLVWPTCHEHDNSISLNTVPIGSKSAFFVTIPLPMLSHLTTSGNSSSIMLPISVLLSVMGSIAKTGSNDTLSSVISSLSMDFSYSDHKSENSSVDLKLVDELSYILIGDKRIPTFYYPPFLLRGSSLFDTSPSIVAMHYIAWQILCSLVKQKMILPKFEMKMKIFDILPQLLNYLILDDQNIQKIASLACANIMCSVPFEKAQELMAPLLNNTTFSIIESLLVSMLLISQPEAVPDMFHRIMYDFLIRSSKEITEIGSLSLVILINGLSFWQTFSTSINLFEYVLRSLVLTSRSEHVHKLFAVIAGSQLQQFSESFDRIVEEYGDISDSQKLISRLFSIIGTIAQANSYQVGAAASLRLANISNKYPKHSNLAMQEIRNLNKYIPTVSVSGNSCIIALRNQIHIFINGKLKYSGSLFDCSISQVSINNESTRGAAYSFEGFAFKVFKLIPEKTSLLGPSKIIIEESLNLDSPPPKIEFVWENESKCVCRGTNNDYL